MSFPKNFSKKTGKCENTFKLRIFQIGKWKIGKQAFPDYNYNLEYSGKGHLIVFYIWKIEKALDMY